MADAREVIANVYVWEDRKIGEAVADAILSALSAAGLKVVGLEPSKAALAVGAQALIDSQPHNGVPQLAVFPAYEIWFAMVHAYDAAPPTQGEKK